MFFYLFTFFFKKIVKNKPKIPTPVLFSQVYAKVLSDGVADQIYCAHQVPEKPGGGGGALIYI